MSTFRFRLAMVFAVASTTLAWPLTASASAPSASPAVSEAPPATDYRQAATLASRWLASQLTKGRIHNAQYDFDDWGLTVDTGLVLADDGSSPAALAQLERAVRQHYYAEYALGGTAAGALSKTLLFATVVRAEVADYGGHDLRTEVLKRVQGKAAGAERGRLSDGGKKDYSNVLSQSLGVLGLAASGGVPQPVVNYLLRQRCSAGYFRLEEVAGKTCDQSRGTSDIDATALALQALVSAHEQGAVLSRGVVDKTTAWLAAQQHSDGSFGAGKLGPNTNTTGLAARALQATSSPAPLNAAAAYVARMQITRAPAKSGQASDAVGAIAYDRAARDTAVAQGIRKPDEDQFRRATAQAYFALAAAPPASAAGSCPTDSGVTVVVDFSSLGGDVVVRCAAAPVTTGLDALKGAGFSYALVATSAQGFVCRIDDQPSPDQEDCQGIPPESAYWSYWNAINGGTWKYSTSGAGRTVTAGGFEGWSFVADAKARPPAVAPLRPDPTTSPSASPSPGSTPGSPASPTSTPLAAGDGSSDGPAGRVLLGLGLVAVLAAGAGLAAWRRSRRT